MPNGIIPITSPTEFVEFFKGVLQAADTEDLETPEQFEIEQECFTNDWEYFTKDLTSEQAAARIVNLVYGAWLNRSPSNDSELDKPSWDELAYLAS